MRWYAIMIICLLVVPAESGAGREKGATAFEIVSDATYVMAPGDAPGVCDALALFGAKYTAVALSAKYMGHIGLLKDYGAKKKEILCLAADGLEVTLLEKRQKRPGIWYTRIRATVELADFTRAEIQNIRLEKEEGGFSWQQEMEQYVGKAIEPGTEISRAYRYLRKKEWRIAVIYLDHLQNKYPNWPEIYSAKAIGFYALNQFRAMADALDTACRLGNKEACQDLAALSAHREPFAP